MNHYDLHNLPPEEFIPRPDHGETFDVLIAVGYDKAALVISAPERFLDWERDKEGSVCNPETFTHLPKKPGVYNCKLRFEIEFENAGPEEDDLYGYAYVCEDAFYIRG